MSYPLLRTADLVPTKYMVDAAASISEDRADSLQFRFDNEQAAVRSCVSAPSVRLGAMGTKPRLRRILESDISVTDGRWTITLGQFGIVGFLAEFGLLALPVFRAASALRFAESERDSVFLAALALIIAINMIDLLPNASLSPWTWLLAGALLGRAEALRGAARQLRRFDRLAGVGLGADTAASEGNSVSTPAISRPRERESLSAGRVAQRRVAADRLDKC